MQTSKTRWAGLVTLASGTLFASTCDAVTETVRLALSIANVWVDF